ncbi:MAG: hypothetical protein KIC80_09030 [Brachyspira sp.]|jgi:hypothetical protein|nr:hypothetical protein [Brachyspira sp.]CCY24511.1 unknown [Brachyspira sp. CAG:484]
MEIIKLKDYPEICDKIDFDIKDGKIIYINFSLNGKNVLIDLKNLFTEMEVSAFSEISFKDIDEKYHPLVNELIKYIEKSERNNLIKKKIIQMKHKNL